MTSFVPRLSQNRRAGLLAAVAVYPLTRLAGTLPRPALDGALVSGIAMTAAYSAASVSTTLARKVARSEQHPSRAGLGAAAVAAGVAVGAAVVSRRQRVKARELAAEGKRLELRPAAVGSVAEVVAVGAGASSLVALVEGIGAKLPPAVAPSHPAVLSLGLGIAAVGVGVGARNTRVARYVSLHGGDAEDVAHFLPREDLAPALGRAVAVAAASITVLTLENQAVDALAGWVDSTDDPGPLARLGGHALVGLGVVALGLGGFLVYSSRVAVQERLLEEAYAAVPSRPGVSGGPTSLFDFGDLGREGRRFVSQAYTADELEGVLGRPAQDPVRAFVPLHRLTGEPSEDAEQMLAELESLGAFDKQSLVLAAPTGDGYVSYVFTESVELLTAGDCATVAMPYAEVPSAVALPRRRRAAEAHAIYARALALRARAANPSIRLFLFGESLGSIVTLDAFGPDVVDEAGLLGFSGGLYAGVPILCRADVRLRPRDPAVRESGGLQYVHTREQAMAARRGHINLTHVTDPTATGDFSTLVRHPVDYWKRPGGAHIPVVSFLVNLADVKNAMNLRPGNFEPSPGHDYRFETAAAVSRAFDLPFDDEERVEHALRERELAWSVKRLLSRRLEGAAGSARAKLVEWGVDPATMRERFAFADGRLPSWLDNLIPETQAHS